MGLFGVSALGTQDVWAVGYHIKTGQSDFLTLIEHWDGHGWTTLPSLFLSGAANILWSVSAPGATDIWAADGGSRTLVEHICPPAKS